MVCGSEANVFAAAALAECKALRRASPAGGVLGGVRPRLVVQGDEGAHGRVAQRGERSREGRVGLGADEHALDAQPRNVRVPLGLVRGRVGLRGWRRARVGVPLGWGEGWGSGLGFGIGGSARG